MGALAAHGFGNQKGSGHGKRGGVELVELNVGKPGAGPESGGHAVARGDAGIGGVAVELPRTTAGENHHVHVSVLLTRRIPIRDAGDAARVGGDLGEKRVFMNAVQARAGGSNEGTRDVRARGVAAGVEHAGV